MPNGELVKQLRVLLEDASNGPSLDDFNERLDARVSAIAAAASPDEQNKFQEELHTVYDDAVDPSQLPQVVLFLGVLHRALPAVPCAALISTWFDLVLRPALREPRLPPAALEQAKVLILAALIGPDADCPKVVELRRLLVQLYLLDAVNESSGEDVLRWAHLGEEERARSFWWKHNLEDTLVRFGLQRTDEFLTTLNESFTVPSHRLQILTLLCSFAAHAELPDTVSAILPHPLLSSILLSLEVDNSSTVCAVALTVVVKLLPAAAIKSYAPLKRILPRLFGVLGRMLCWRARPPRSAVAYADLLDVQDDDRVMSLERAERDDEGGIEEKDGHEPLLVVRNALGWDRLERSFDAIASPAPAPDQFFGFLHYLFPCNTIHFLRHPVAYLNERGVESPWTLGWDEVLDELRIRTTGTLLLRARPVQPSVIWQDVVTELEDPQRWVSYSVATIVGECTMMGNAGASSDPLFASPSHLYRPSPSNASADEHTPTVHALEVGSGSGSTSSTASPPRQRRMSLQDLLAASATLRASSASDMQPLLFAPAAGSPPRSASTAQTAFSASSNHTPNASAAAATDSGTPPMPAEIVETIAGLQREVLLLRTELHFELWLKRESARHVARLHQDHIKTRDADLERNALHSRLREYRVQLGEARTELKRYQDQAQDMKVKNMEWSTQLQSKLNDLRDQKKQWMASDTELRSANVDLKAHLEAQGNLLAEAQRSVFELETQIKEDAHKVQRLRDYERRIDQLTTMHRMWNKDIVLYNEQSHEMDALVGEYQKLKLRVESYEKAQEAMEANALANRQRVDMLEATLRSPRRGKDTSAISRATQMISAHAEERDGLVKSNKALREENAELCDEVEELKAMVEVLKAQAKGTKGLIHPEALSPS